MMRRGLTGAAFAALAALAVFLAAPAGLARPSSNAAGGPTIDITRFDSPLDPARTAGGFGYGVLLTADASLAIVGVYTNVILCDSAAYVYERVGDEWMTSASHVFTNPDGTKYACGFFAAALSADGSTAVLAAPARGTNPSKLFVYAHSDGLWSEAPVAVLDGCFCFGPAELSADGSALLLSNWGEPVDGLIVAGAVYLYEKVNGRWGASPVVTFTEPVSKKFNKFGRSVAMTPDGAEVLIGTAPGWGEGKAYLYRIPDSGQWPAKPQPVAVFNDPAGQIHDAFGMEVALSDAGDAAFILNDPNASDNPTTQGIYLFEKTAGQWPAQPTGKFLIPDPDGGFKQHIINGFALSGDGKTLFVGAPRTLDRSSGPLCCNVIYVYTKRNGAWSYTSPTNVLEEPDAVASPYENAFGGNIDPRLDIASSFDGSIVMIGDPQIPGASPIPPNEIPTYGGPGVAFAFVTTNGWQKNQPPPPPPRPGPPPRKSGSGGLGWLTLVALLALLVKRRRWL